MLNLFYNKNNLLENLKIKDKSYRLKKQDIGYTIYIYNGKKYIPILIKESMINYPIGKYIFTKKIYIKKKKKTYGTRRKSN